MAVMQVAEAARWTLQDDVGLGFRVQGPQDEQLLPSLHAA